MNEVFRYFYYFLGVPLLKFVNELIPKDRKIIVFSSSPDFADNSWFLYKKIIENECMKQKGFKYIWVVYNPKASIPDVVKNNPDTEVIQAHTIESIKYTFLAKYFVSSHKIPLFKSDNQIGVYITHGLPLKTWGLRAKDVSKTSLIIQKIIMNSKNYYLIVTSRYTVKLLSDLTGINEKYILPLGYPRNDILIDSSSEVESSNVRYSLDIPSEAKLIVYLPTFRRNNRSKEIIKEICINKKLNKFLIKNNLMLIIKPHPNDELLFKSESFLISRQNRSRILIITNEMLNILNTDLYSLLRESDMLITDYSSVTFDYLFLNRPIIFYIPDFKEYEKERGIYLQPYEKWTPGDKTRNIDELIKAIIKNMENPKLWEKERIKIRNILFNHVDGKSSERIIKYFWCENQ